MEIATAYTIFTNDGAVRPLSSILRVVENGESRAVTPPRPRNVARADTTFLVSNMMRSVVDEGTAAGARAAGFTRSAAGKTGTTNDLRDAWFVGFTPDLLTIVWVGLDDNTPIGLSGSQAAVPIWASFMRKALAGLPDRTVDPPPGVVFADIDRDTGQLATAACPRVIHEAFLENTAPTEFCHEHGMPGVSTVFSKVGGFFQRLLR